MTGPQGNIVSSPAPEKKVKKDALVGNLLAGKYKIIKKIGEGGMGSVYIANQETIDRKVAGPVKNWFVPLPRGARLPVEFVE